MEAQSIEKYKCDVGGGNELLIMSWNVASLTTTVDRLKKVDGMSLSDFLDRHGVDILCVQEHKIALDKLTSRQMPPLLPSDTWDSYWSCCTVEKKTGFNGVATFVRSSSSSATVIGADCHSLQDPSLDRQGRCLLTVHPHFCVFNIYVPCMYGDEKMRFLSHLDDSMSRVRKYYQGAKPIILAGDFNMVPNPPMDRHWSFQCIQLPDTETKTVQEKEEEEWRSQMVQHWPKIFQMLSTKQAVAVKTKNTRTNATFDKWRVCLWNDDKKTKIFVGGYELTPEAALSAYEIETVDASNTNDDSSTSRVIINISVLAELMLKCVGVSWSEVVQRQIACELSVPSETTLWFRKHLLEKNQMIDTFRMFHPTAQERFTCWYQYTNERSQNRGSRIDYILVDPSLLQCLQKGGSLRKFSETTDANSHQAAWEAATANGKWEGSSFTGDGIFHAHADLQFSPSTESPSFSRHTGIVYTPPSYSDHVPVTALFQLTSDITSVNENKPPYVNRCQTKKAQPHKSQPSISQFFSSNQSTKNVHKKNPNPIKPKIASTKKGSILHHFTSKTNKN